MRTHQAALTIVLLAMVAHGDPGAGPKGGGSSTGPKSSYSKPAEKETARKRGHVAPSKELPACIVERRALLDARRHDLLRVHGGGKTFEDAYSVAKAELLSTAALEAAKCAP